MEAEDFLELVWGDIDGPEHRGWVDLPSKVGRYWVPYPKEWPPYDDTTVSGRIDRCLFDREDLYYSVAMFSERGRAHEHTLPTGWLWADLDEVHPSKATEMGLMPTIAVESSPGRYQALWQLTRPLRPPVLEKLNQALTYALGADKGGWDLTQVLRVPGTRNFKYPNAPFVKMMWYEKELVYKARYVLDRVRAAVPAGELRAMKDVELPKKPIPYKAKRLLLARQDEVVEGERSARLWELNCLLAEAGLNEEEIFKLVVHCAWNKWRGQRLGNERLRLDVQKAVRHVRRKAAENATAKRTVDRGADRGEDNTSSARDDGDAIVFPVVSYSSFMAMAMEKPKWLIEDIWTAGSHGFIGGEPKTSKTTIALALGLAVASGRDFLGRFAVGTQGPVLFVQEENAPWMMQDRMRKLSVEMGIVTRSEIQEKDLPDDVPLQIVNNAGFDLSEETHRDFLEGYVSEMRPVLVILDPLYLIFGPINANEQGQVQPFLKWIIALRYKYDCAVMIVHHMGKKSETTVGRRAGQRLLGSATLHGFTDSALYTSALSDPRGGWTKVLIEREFRAMEPQDPIEMAWHFDRPGALGMQLEVARQDLEGAIAARVRQEDGITIASLVKEMGLDRRTILARIRGGELMHVEGSGRGKIQRVYMATSSNGRRAASRE
jgi:hypothetical protein